MGQSKNKSKTKNKKPLSHSDATSIDASLSTSRTVIGKGDEEDEENKVSSSYPIKRLTVSLTRRTKQQQQQQQQLDPNQKILLLSQQDVLDLNLFSHDEVLIMTFRDLDKEIKDDYKDPCTILSIIKQQQQTKRCIMAVCQIQIVRGIPSKHSATRGATLTGPSWFLERFFQEIHNNNNKNIETGDYSTSFYDEMTQSSFDGTNSHTINKDPTSKPIASSSSSSYSFTHLSSPSSTSTPNTTTISTNKKKPMTPTSSQFFKGKQHNTSNLPNIQILIIPIKRIQQLNLRSVGSDHNPEAIYSSVSSTNSKIDTRISFIGKAKSITLQPIDRSSSSSSSSSRSWETLETSTLELLILSYLYKLYISVGDIVAVYILGQRVLFRVLDIQEEEDEVVQYKMNNQRHETKNSIISTTSTTQTTNTTRSNTRLLYQMSLNTRIIHVQQDPRNVVDTTTSLVASLSDLHISPPSISVQRQVIVAGFDLLLQQIYSYILPSLFYNPPSTSSSTHRVFLRPSKGLLLHGPNGVGKTLLAQQIVLDFDFYNKNHHELQGNPFPCTICNTLTMKNQFDERRQVYVEWISCAYLQAMSSFLGEGEKVLTRIFDQAEYRAHKENKSSLLILDDIHLIASTRSFSQGGGGITTSSSSDRITSTLLALLDGIGKYNTLKQDHFNPMMTMGHVFILAMTSKPMELDSALRRAGRMDKEIEIPIPDEHGRGEIFTFLFEKLVRNGIEMDPSLFSSTQISSLSKLAKGFTGADCTLSIKEAVREAIISSQPQKEYSEPTSSSSSEGAKVILTLDHIQRAIRKTKPSSIKSISVEIPSVLWSSIGGMNQVKQQLREAIEYPLKYEHVFKKMNIPPPKGILLYGPPGCSKTLLARALATEGHMNFLAVKGPELLSKWCMSSMQLFFHMIHVENIF